MKQHDFLVIGSGIAGLTAAYFLADIGTVLVVSKGRLKDSSSSLAQGGVSAVLTPGDSFKKHIRDTMIAGARHNKREAVEFLVKEAPSAIRFLKSIGVRFRKTPHLEGGHSVPRIWHTGDKTGQSIINSLFTAIKKKKNVTLKGCQKAAELIVRKGRCCGAYINCRPILARFTLLATGGLGQMYDCTSNPDAATGDGLILALRAGLKLKDLEFIQFHPTALDMPVKGNRYFLISESLRGYGAKVVNARGEEFLFKYHKNGSLAPRDVVTRGIFFEQQRGPVFLDLRHLDQDELKKEFPMITQTLRRHGLDTAKDLIPVTPIAHYSCGGIPTDLHGATAFAGLYAVGEVACIGAQGANRLASNSLLEGIVFARAAVRDIRKKLKSVHAFHPPCQSPKPSVSGNATEYKKIFKKIKKIMWQNVGIIRTKESLKRAGDELSKLRSSDHRIQGYQLLCSEVIRACQRRKKSLGAHYMQ